MRIAIVRLSALGDIIQTSIVLQFIREKYQNATIDWFVDSRFESLLQENEELTNVISINLKKYNFYNFIFEIPKLFLTLRKLERYDAVIDFQGLIKSSIISKFLPATERYGFDWSSSKEPICSVFYSKKVHINYSENVLKRYITLINKSLNLRISVNDIHNKRPLFKIEKNFKKNKTKKIVIVLGASFQSKIYSVENFAKVAQNINAQFIGIWGNSKEKNLAKKLNLLSPNVDVSKRLNFKELIELISESDLVIGGDTGPTHLAWGLNIPSITIFGPTAAQRNFFQTKINRFVHSFEIVDLNKINKHESSINDISHSEIVKISNTLLELKR